VQKKSLPALLLLSVGVIFVLMEKGRLLLVRYKSVQLGFSPPMNV